MNTIQNEAFFEMCFMPNTLLYFWGNQKFSYFFWSDSVEETEQIIESLQVSPPTFIAHQSPNPPGNNASGDDNSRKTNLSRCLVTFKKGHKLLQKKKLSIQRNLEIG